MHTHTTITASVSTAAKKRVDQAIQAGQFRSVDDAIETALAHIFPVRYFTIDGREMTENGFTPEFEDEVLRAAAEPDDNDRVIETEKDLELFFEEVMSKAGAIRHAQKQ